MKVPCPRTAPLTSPTMNSLGFRVNTLRTTQPTHLPEPRGARLRSTPRGCRVDLLEVCLSVKSRCRPQELPGPRPRCRHRGQAGMLLPTTGQGGEGASAGAPPPQPRPPPLTWLSRAGAGGTAGRTGRTGRTGRRAGRAGSAVCACHLATLQRPPGQVSACPGASPSRLHSLCPDPPPTPLLVHLLLATFCPRQRPLSRLLPTIPTETPSLDVLLWATIFSLSQIPLAHLLG